jgi:hypothetical protein
MRGFKRLGRVAALAAAATLLLSGCVMRTVAGDGTDADGLRDVVVATDVNVDYIDAHPDGTAAPSGWE